MKNLDIEELMALNWAPVVDSDPEGGCVLTVQGLDDFAVCGTSEADVLEQFTDALRSHLSGYLATRKFIPVPAGRVVQERQDTGGAGEWAHLGFNAVTGRLRTEPSTA